MRSASVPCGLSSTSSSPLEEEPLEDLVLAHVGRDHLLHLAVGEQDAEALVGGAAVVRDDGERAGAATVERGDQVLGVARETEAAGHQRAAVRQVLDRGIRRREELVHVPESWGVMAGEVNEWPFIFCAGRVT
jgi:hypothetical protein